MHRTGMESMKKTLAVIGGTGDLGSGLAKRWAEAGYAIILGSRDSAKAEAAAQAMRAELVEKGVAQPDLRGMDNLAAAQAGELVVLTVPFSQQRPMLEQIRPALDGKILVDVTVPLVPPKVMRVQLPAEGSAGVLAQQLLGDSVRVVSAFQNVAAHHLQAGNRDVCDVLVCGDSKDARAEVVELVDAIGLRGLHAGSINNSAAAEALTSLLIFMNKHYGGHAGIRITGLD